MSAAEIARLRLPGLPTTKANVIARAEKEGWYYEEATGLGGKRRVYEVPQRYFQNSAIAETVAWLQHSLGYPPDSIRRNVRVRTKPNEYRYVDIAVFGDSGYGVPESIEVVVECKRAGELSDKSLAEKEYSAIYEDAFGESRLYDLVCALEGSRWAVVTDGRQRTVFEVQRGEKGVRFIPAAALPSFRPKIEQLKEERRDAGMSNAELLEAIIVGVERFASEVGEAVNPQRKATLISLFYRYFLDEGKVDQQKLTDMLRKVG